MGGEPLLHNSLSTRDPRREVARRPRWRQVPRAVCQGTGVAAATEDGGGLTYLLLWPVFSGQKALVWKEIRDIYHLETILAT